MSEREYVAEPLDENERYLELSYNHPLEVPPNFSAICPQTSQASSVLQIENLSTSNVLSYYVNAGGGFDKTGTIPANDATPKTWVHNFNGAKLVVTNISTRNASALVTLRST